MALLLFFICTGVLFGFSTAASDPVETAALLSFKASVTSDPKNSLSGWTGNDPCSSSWNGITCSTPAGTPVNGTKRVTELSLSWKGLSGRLAPELGNLTYLTLLNLKFNQLEGSIPSSFGKLNKLKKLLLNNNNLSGSLAWELGSGLSSLRRFQINTNNIIGPIPPTFGNLTECKHLHFSNNSLNGSIPDDIHRLSHLLHILLDNNQLSGPLPPSLNSIPNLTTIQIDNNSIDSSIPTTWGQISKLFKLSLANCSLTGTIPDLSGLQSMTYLDLSNNSLTGTLPNLSTTLYTINLANNTLNGTIPDAYGQMQQLQTLNIQNNRVSGAIPTTLGTGKTFFDGKTMVDINLESNLLEEGVGTALRDAVGRSHCKVWMAGNPACTLFNNASQSTVHCGVYSNNTLNNAPFSPDSTSGCPATTCNPPEVQAPSNMDSNMSCRCAEPVTVTMQLISPAFSYFTPNILSNNLSDFLNGIFRFSTENYSYIALINSTWLYNPPRLQATLHVFPLNEPFSQDDINAMEQHLTDFNFDQDKENDLDYLIMGPYEFLSLTTGTTSSKSLSSGAVAGIALGCAAVAAILASVILLWCLHRHGYLLTPAIRKLHSRGLSKNSARGIKIAGMRDFTFEEMAAATENFKNEIGEGGYGKVYKGILKDGSVVAIKRAHEGCVQGFSAFYTEIDLLSRVHHRNLVELIGYCDGKGEQMLVYEFMPGGTLRDHLHQGVATVLASMPVGFHDATIDLYDACGHDKNNKKATEVLHFVTRMRIALATARGILYLHCDANPPIFHRDIKANNILLDDNFNAKVADFGLSRLAPMPDLEGGHLKHHVSTVVKGTPGYLDPEYFLTQKLTDKSDVYSFGVVLMELVTGLQPIHHGKNLVREVFSAYEASRIAGIVDPYLSTYPPKAMESLVTLAIDCCRDSPELRPNMTQVVRQLEDIARMIEPWSIPERDIELTEDLPQSDPQSVHVFTPQSDPQSAHMSTETARTELLRESIAGLGGR